MFSNDISITKIIDKGCEEYERHLNEKLRNHSHYNEKVQEFQDICDKETSKETALKLDAACVAIEIAARDIAFDEGFKLGVRLILNCMGGLMRPQEVKTNEREQVSAVIIERIMKLSPVNRRRVELFISGLLQNKSQ